MNRRPKSSEDEEDILRMQEEFLKDKNFQPSAQVVNLRKTDHQTTKRTSTTTSDTRKLSKYAQSKGLCLEKRPRMDTGSGAVLGAIVEKYLTEKQETEPNDDKVFYPTVIPSVLGEIVEKEYNEVFDLHFKTTPTNGFPTVSKRDPNMKTGLKSIFAQETEKCNKYKTAEIDIAQPSGSFSVCNEKINVPIQSYIVTSNEADAIHEANINILSRMSEQNILQEQQKLCSSLSPQLIDFIKAKREKIQMQKNMQSLNSGSNDNSEMRLENFDEARNVKDPPKDCLWENDVLLHPEVNKWLHFENYEQDKLEWIKGIEDCKMVKPNEPYEARFDFKGYLLPYILDYTENTKTLYHHGEEAHRPGYSITELIELSRSSMVQQRVMALNTISGILEHYIAGLYKNVIEIPLSKIFFVIRIAMDENKLILLEPALRAMRNLLYNRIDEACLDALLGFEEGNLHPYLENDKSEIEEMDTKETELNDFHIAELDIITIILRTDILQRLFYVIDILKPNFNAVQYSIQILIRLSRDSIESSNKIAFADHLMTAIINHFIPIAGIHFLLDPECVYKGLPVLAAFKLMRILSLQSKEICEILISKYELLRHITVYVSSIVNNVYGLRLQIEAFCILINFLNYGLGTEIALSLCPLIICSLYNHVQGTDIFIESSVVTVTHAAVILQYINKLFKCDVVNVDNYKYQICPLLKEGAHKWLMQTANRSNYTCGHLRLLSSVLDCCRTVFNNEKPILKFLNDILKTFNVSKGFQCIIDNIIPSSNLLSKIEDKEIHYIKNLSSLGGIDSTQKVLPILNIMSPIPLLVSLFKFLNSFHDEEIAKLFQDKMLKYLETLTNNALTLKDNWFTRMEVEFVFNVIKLSIECEISEPVKDIIYVLANKLCYILRLDRKVELHYLFNNVIFNKHLFTTERLFNLITIGEKEGFSTALINVDEIKLCYTKVININQTELTGDNIAIKKWQEPILPRDWIYMPILMLYSSSQELQFTPIFSKCGYKTKQEQEVQKELIIRCTLEWVLLNEIICPDLLNDIDVTDRFCRIMCVFLCDSSLFLDKNINMLLRKCMQLLYKNCQKFNFNKQLAGLSNFQDFYTQCLEQFQSVSYGDYVFSSYVLVPLAQKHDVKWRKLLWSEYAGCLRALDCPENYLCYNLVEYYYPEETDESLLKSYSRALTSNLIRPDSIAYKIAQHHVENFKKRKLAIK